MKNPAPSTHHRLLSIMATVGGLTAMAGIMAAVKDLAIARQFGVSDAVEAFVFASMLPMFASSVIGFSFNAALIPTYVSLRENDGVEAAQRLVSTTLVWAIMLLSAVSIVLGIAFPLLVPLLKGSFSPAKLYLTRSLFVAMLPIIVLRGVSAIYAAVLNAGERYRLAASVPAITPCCMLVAMYSFSGSLGIYSLGLGMVVGMAMEAIVLARGLNATKFSAWPKWRGMDEPAREVVRQYVPMIAGSCLSSSTIVVDQTFASTLGSGSLATLSYAAKVVGFATAICATAVSTAVLPHFCTLVARSQWKEMSHALYVNLRLVMAGTVVLATALCLFSEHIVGLLFQHGAFHAADTLAVAHVQRMYALQIPFYVAGTFVVRLISSLRGNSILMWGAGMNVVVNVVLDYVLMRKMGVSGIALSTTGVYLISFIYLWISLKRRMAHMTSVGSDRIAVTTR